MVEKFGIPHAPTDKPNGADGKRRERPEPKKRGLIGKAFKSLTNDGRRTLRQERSAAQRAREAREHLSEPERLRERLKEFDAALYYVPSLDSKPIAGLINLLYKKARRLKMPKSGEEKTAAENALVVEAKVYLFTGLMPRGEELVDALRDDEKRKKSGKELRHMRHINDRAVRRHMRKYLEWRWVSDDWKKRWDAWNKQQPQKKDAPQKAAAPTSVPKWEDETNEWIRIRNQHIRQKVTNEPVPPPALPEQLLVVRIAKRVGEDHLQWKVGPLKPEVAEN